MKIKFTFFDKKHSFISGRLDDYVVPLRAGSTYTLKASVRTNTMADNERVLSGVDPE